MNWLIAENELDLEQRDFLDKLLTSSSNLWIQGFPGSGKTILLLYSAQRIRKINPEAKILFVEFTHSLIKMLRAALHELHYDDIEVITYYDFVGRVYTEQFDYILCDEVQDMPRVVLETMVKRSKRVVVAGDVNQSIWDTDPQWGKETCKPSEIVEVLNPEITALTIIHRLPLNIIKAVHAYMPEVNIIGGRHSMMKQNVQIRLKKAKNYDSEVAYLLEKALDPTNQGGDTVGILLRTHNQIIQFANRVLEQLNKPIWEEVKNKYGKPDFGKLNIHFKQNKVPIQYVANRYGSFADNPDVITLTTYHSSKGLDFDTVLLPGCSNYAYSDSFEDRTLLMVGMTRTRKNLYISHAYGGWDSSILKFMDQKDLYHYEDEEGGKLLFPESSMSQPGNTTRNDKTDIDSIFE